MALAKHNKRLPASASSTRLTPSKRKCVIAQTRPIYFPESIWLSLVEPKYSASLYNVRIQSENIVRLSSHANRLHTLATDALLFDAGWFVGGHHRDKRGGNCPKTRTTSGSHLSADDHRV